MARLLAAEALLLEALDAAPRHRYNEGFPQLQKDIRKLKEFLEIAKVSPEGWERPDPS